MGVTGLWKLIEPSGKPVPLETLENKVLAIDISIWLHQVVKGFQDNKGNTLAHAHLLGLFHRLCKLLYYRIKPVFVFDGGIPHLKRETITKRSQNKNKILTEADRLQTLLLQTLAKERVVQEALGSKTTEILKSPSKNKPPILQKPDKDDIFKLPELPTIEETPEPSASTSSLTTDSDSSLDERTLRAAYAHNLQAVDVKSDQFQSLPADIRYEILNDIKETRKQSSWGRLHELPAKSDAFSSFQMKRLLKRRQVQVSLEEAEKQMEGRSLTLHELQKLLSEDGVIAAHSIAVDSTTVSKRIASDDSTRYLLVRDLKKAIEAAVIKKEEERQNSQRLKEFQERDLSEMKNKNNDIDDEDEQEIDDEYDEDLQKAIQMSLESSNPVYNDKDYETDEIKMNREQRKLLKDAAESLAKAYLIEYGGMNEDEVKEMLQQSQISQNDDSDELSSSLSFRFNDKFIAKGEVCSPYRQMKIPLGNETSSNSDSKKSDQLNQSTQNNEIKITNDEFISDSDDSDLIEVAEREDPSPVKSTSKVETEKHGGKFQIVIDLTKEIDQDDIFADIFQSEHKLENMEKKHLEKADLVSRENTNESNLKNRKIFSEHKDKSEEDQSSMTTKIEEKVVIEESDVEMENVVESKKMNNETLKDIIPTNHDNILEKLKRDLENIQKITLDDDVEMENKKVNTDCIMQKSLDVNITCGSSEKPNNNQAKAILDSLKKEFSEISKINLDDIKIDTPPLQTTVNDENKIQTAQEQMEIIEIPDSDNNDVTIKTPSKQKVQQEAISNYFEPEYKIKRTPEKAEKEEEKEDFQSTPKVKKPFFVRKTPGSSDRKRKENSIVISDDDDDINEIPSKKGRKISKALFDSSKDQNKIENDDTKAINDNPLQIAAKTLKENKTQAELEVIASDIAKEKRNLELERNKQDRMGTSITDKMSYECMRLLRLFGIPYIVAPMEAEAQCAFLDATNLTDGTITDDSDIWLFGGKTVYKNFFNQQKHVMEFRVENIEKLFNVDRKKLIQLAILVGSDYTTGINGVGAVTALEILATFPPTPPKDGETSEVMSVLSSLRKFREWWRAGGGKLIGPNGRTALRSKLKNIELTEGFPNLQVVESYLNPKVDTNREKFSWGTPDVETIYEFTKKNFGWTKLKTDNILQPVLKKINEKKIQSSIKNYFTVKSASTVREMKVSKRVQNAIDKLSFDPEKHHEIENDESKPKKSRNRKTAKHVTKATATTSKEEFSKEEKVEPKKRKRKKNIIETNNDETASSTSSNAIPSTSSHTVPSKPKLSKLLIDSDEIIPQREKDFQEMRKRKEKAAEILRTMKANPKGKKHVPK